MRTVVLCLLVLGLASVAAWGQVQVQSQTDLPLIPVYGNAELITEVNISEQDILGYLQIGLAAFGGTAKGAVGELGEVVKAADLETLASALSGLKQVRILQFQLGQVETSARVLDFYMNSIGPGWRRILWDVSKPYSGFMLITDSGMNNTLLVAVEPPKPPASEKGEKPAVVAPVPQRLVVIRAVGMIDIQKLGTWMGNAVTRFSQIHERERKEKAAKASTAKPSPSLDKKKPATKCK